MFPSHDRSRLRDVLVLQKNTPTQDDNGQPIESWGDVRQLRCEVLPKSAREFNRNGNIDSSVTSIIRCRYVDINPTPLYRFQNLNGTKTYNIVGVYDPDMLNRTLEIHVMEAGV
jgi:SPP1 family predicted phage head-tail adaptor